MKTTLLSLALATFTTIGTTVAQSASFQRIGASCTTSEGTPTLSNTGLPVIGQTMSIDYAGPNLFGGAVFSFRPHLVIGFSTFTPPVTIPQGLFLSQPANCELRVTHDIVLAMPIGATPGEYRDSQRITIPNAPALIGTSFNAQWLTVYTQVGIVPGAFVVWIATSETGVAVIGT